MEKFDKMLEKIITPPRTNSKNNYFDQKNHFDSFNIHEFNLITFDRIVLPVIYFQHKSCNSFTTTIVYSHSFGSCKYEGMSYLHDCKDLGLNYCIYDSRGCGASSEGPISFGFNEKVDLLFVLLKLNFDFKCGNFLLWGRSIGCNAVLQLYQTLISHESQFLNALYQKQYMRQVQRDKTQAYKIRLEKPKMLPENHNKFISLFFQKFLYNNIGKEIYNKYTEYNIGFRIEGLILDSPYTSFEDYFQDNVRRFVPQLPSFLVSPVFLYLKTWLNSRLKVDLSQKQNIDIIQVVNINTLFIVSDQDEMIPEPRFKSFGHNFASKVIKKNLPIMRNVGQKHGSKRNSSFIRESLEIVLKNRSNLRTYFFKHT